MGTSNIPYFNGFYYDLLSGEFKPAADTLARSHTLSRLAVAAFQKGEDMSNGGRVYHPSWANFMRVVVDVSDSRVMNALSLINPVDVMVSFVDSPEGLTVVADGTIHEFPYQLGPNLDQGRIEIANFACAFFDASTPNPA